MCYNEEHAETHKNGGAEMDEKPKEKPLASVETVVSGVRMKLLTTDDQSYIDMLAGRINAIINTFPAVRPSQGVDLPHKLILAALVIADEAYKSEQDIRERERALAASEREADLRISELTSEMAKERTASKREIDKLTKQYNEACSALEQAIKEKAILLREYDTARREADNLRRELKDFVDTFPK